MARSDYDIINLSLEHELNEWLAERGYAGLADNRNRLAEVVTRKLQDSFYINVSWDALNTAYKDLCFSFPLHKPQHRSHF
ncbi:hypothetical protein E9W13_004646 [Escherichia coli]|uniref:hypothetical protein n=2 Tax=Escherichia coli TaxID=562 RepID=UPI0006A5E7DD|nr:hypothetical protein [Escherichia coli]EEY2618068.1 hypothetical protein [Escherichia coli]EEZ2587251.1 hypothetical protein [Escherichia coli]EEZ3613947.1 hypothetical protein [Escherichia coli]EFA8993555.1 hypothetical protein [Escherichia coli]EFC8756986.1 hypothetical protein [Escherichia coli]